MRNRFMFAVPNKMANQHQTAFVFVLYVLCAHNVGATTASTCPSSTAKSCWHGIRGPASALAYFNANFEMLYNTFGAAWEPPTPKPIVPDIEGAGVGYPGYPSFCFVFSVTCEQLLVANFLRDPANSLKEVQLRNACPSGQTLAVFGSTGTSPSDCRVFFLNRQYNNLTLRNMCGTDNCNDPALPWGSSSGGLVASPPSSFVVGTSPSSCYANVNEWHNNNSRAYYSTPSICDCTVRMREVLLRLLLNGRFLHFGRTPTRSHVSCLHFHANTTCCYDNGRIVSKLVPMFY